MDEFLKSADIQNYSFISAGIMTLMAVLYKTLRIVKRDHKEDALDGQEAEFRNMILSELKNCKEFSNQMLIEKAELKSKIASLEAQVAYLLSVIRKAGLETISFRNQGNNE